MRFAVIDLGTNTFNLLIGILDLNNKSFSKIIDSKIPVKLGEKAINQGHIATIAFKRGIEALLKFKTIIDGYKINNIYAFATSAIRSASNGDEFVRSAFEKCGINIKVIDGNEEAELIYYGTRKAVRMDANISLIMDIGGGSTEFILADANTIFWKQSFLLGVSRIFEKFNFSNPITDDEENFFFKYLKEELKPLFIAIKTHRPTELIGSSGSFDSLIDIIAAQFHLSPIHQKQTEYAVDLNHYKFVSNLIIKSTVYQRQNLKGLIEMRVDMIAISMMLIDFILSETKIDQLRVSTYSLKEGVIYRMLNSKERSE